MHLHEDEIHSTLKLRVLNNHVKYKGKGEYVLNKGSGMLCPISDQRQGVTKKTTSKTL
jgi:hypothetical protein